MSTNRRYGRPRGVQESWNLIDGKPSNHPGKACSPGDGGEYIGARNYIYGSVRMKDPQKHFTYACLYDKGDYLVKVYRLHSRLTH